MKVAKILDCYTVAITKTDGPLLGLGDILSIGTEPVIDPETGECIGHYPQLRVRVIQVYTKFVIAETYRLITQRDTDRKKVTVNVGDDVLPYRL